MAALRLAVVGRIRERRERAVATVVALLRRNYYPVITRARVHVPHIFECIEASFAIEKNLISQLIN